MQEMKEKELNYNNGNGDANSHVCKVCFESPTTTMLLPCRHFSCKLNCFSSNITLPTLSSIKLNLIFLYIFLFLQCVNLVQLRVPSVRFAVPRLLIEFLLSHLDICILPPPLPSLQGIIDIYQNQLLLSVSDADIICLIFIWFFYADL